MKNVIRDNKGYMLVEIIVASAIAITMAFFLMEMTLKIVNKNNDYYVESVLLFDKNIVTKEIMDDINSKKLVGVERIDDRTLILTYDDNTTRNLSVNDNTISYGDYHKKLSNELNVEEPVLEPKDNTLIISINAYTNYSKEDYGIKIVVPYSNIKIKYPTISKCYDILDNSGLGSLKHHVKNKQITEISSATIEDEHAIYESADDLGPSCYFRGDVDYNYVKFGKNTKGKDMYWRIVRINGDGTIRMIYDGTSTHANGVESEDRQIGLSVFNESSNNNAYVGYMYGNAKATTFELTHENKNDSTMKSYLDNWYSSVFSGKSYEQYIADAIYCSDRTIEEFRGIIGSGIKTSETYYAGYTRNINKSPAKPSLICSQANDRFAVSSTLGNGKLTYPVGLLTWDEVIFAGALQGEENRNKSFYLYSGTYYFIMTPSGFFEDSGPDGVPDGIDKAFVAFFNSNGRILSGGGVDVERGVRPVISLKSDAIKYGTGSSTDPFRVEQ